MSIKKYKNILMPYAFNATSPTNKKKISVKG